MSYKRVISLLPSATEMMFALNAQHLLVARSHECDFPIEAQQLPICTSTSIHNGMSSAEIDVQVRDKVLNSLSLYEVDIELIKNLKPDLIITQDQCKVCAVHLSDLKELLRNELGYELYILSFHPHSIDDFFENFNELAKLISKEDVASRVTEDWHDRLDIIKHKVKFVKNRPRIVCIEWMEPLMTAGHWTPELIQIAGGESILSNSNQQSEYIKIDQIIEADPDGIIIAPCGFPLERVKEELDELLTQDKWRQLRAVQKGHIFIADGNSYFNRPSPRLIDTAEIIAEILQVNQFYYGMEGLSWDQIVKYKD